MKSINDYRDPNGLLTQLGGDGGDSLNRTCATAVLYQLASNSIDQNVRLANGLSHQSFRDAAFKLCDAEQAKYRRSTHEGKWYSNYDRTSRDQLTPLIIMLGLLNTRDRLWRVFKDHLKRGLLFAYNTKRNFQYPTLEEHQLKSTPDVKWDYKWKVPDLTGPEFWTLYIRGFRAWYLYPLLLILDIETLGGSIHIWNKHTKDDVINHTLVLEYAKVRLPTPWTWLASKITSRKLLQERLDTFFGKINEPPINELYRELET